VQSSASGASVLSPSKPAAAASVKKTAKKDVQAVYKEPNFIQKAVEFVTETRVELKKVTWPTRKQTTGTTVVVIIFVFVVAVFLGLFDLGLSKLVQVVLT
jgi:preprotein translocase subunit SecE